MTPKGMVSRDLRTWFFGENEAASADLFLQVFRRRYEEHSSSYTCAIRIRMSTQHHLISCLAWQIIGNFDSKFSIDRCSRERLSVLKSPQPHRRSSSLPTSPFFSSRSHEENEQLDSTAWSGERRLFFYDIGDHSNCQTSTDAGEKANSGRTRYRVVFSRLLPFVSSLVFDIIKPWIGQYGQAKRGSSSIISIKSAEHQRALKSQTEWSFEVWLEVLHVWARMYSCKSSWAFS